MIFIHVWCEIEIVNNSRIKTSSFEHLFFCARKQEFHIIFHSIHLHFVLKNVIQIPVPHPSDISYSLPVGLAATRNPYGGGYRVDIRRISSGRWISGFGIWAWQELMADIVSVVPFKPFHLKLPLRSPASSCLEAS